MTNSESNSNNSKFKYDLEERTAIFGERVIKFTQGLPRTVVTLPIISQLIRSATSIGANYCEANDAESRQDFKHKLGICRKESRETMHWFRMLVAAVPDCAVGARILWQEAKECNLIFSAAIRSTKDSKKR